MSFWDLRHYVTCGEGADARGEVLGASAASKERKSGECADGGEHGGRDEQGGRKRKGDRTKNSPAPKYPLTLSALIHKYIPRYFRILCTSPNPLALNQHSRPQLRLF